MRILHIAHGINSYNNSLAELINRLQSADTEIVVASHKDLSESLYGLGTKFEHLTHDKNLIEQYRTESGKLNNSTKFIKLWKKLVLLRRYRSLSLKNNEIQTLINRVNPDILLIDMECHFSIITALSINIPVVLCSRWFSVFRSTGLPPMHTALQPGTDIRNRLAINWSWYRLMIYKSIKSLRYRFGRHRLYPVTYKSASRMDLAALSRSLNLHLNRISSTRHWLIPHVYNNLPVMSLTPKELEFPQADDPRMHYVGAMVSTTSKIKSQSHQKAMKSFNEFISHQRMNSTKLVYCSLSTFWSTSANHIAPILDLFQRRQDLTLVVGLGGRTAPTELGMVPDNILVLEYAPQLEILTHAQVVITHGGISTINEALHHGIPLLVYSSGHVDQDGCMARINYHKVGLTITSESLKTSELEESLDRLLDVSCENEFRENARRVQGVLRRYEVDQAAVNFLASFKNQPSNGT